MSLEIRLDRPAVRRKVDALRVLEVHVLYPGDAPAGGLLRVLELDGTQVVGESTVVLDETDVKGVRESMAGWVEATLRRHGRIGDTSVSVVDVAPIAPSVAPAASGPTLGTLG